MCDRTHTETWGPDTIAPVTSTIYVLGNLNIHHHGATAEQLASIATGRAKAGKTLAGFDVVPTVPVVIGEDLQACAAPLRAYAALYVGGMGSREQNFYNALACRMGYAEAAAEVQHKYLAKDTAGAMAAVPFEFIDRTALIGPRERIAERLHAYAESGVTTLTVATYAATLDERIATLRTVAELIDEEGLA